MPRPSSIISCFLVVVVLASVVVAADDSATAPAAADATGLDLDAYRGQVVYLDFWASWCVPCKQSFPWMIELQDRLAEKGLAVVTVNVDRNRKAADRFLSEMESDLEVVYDPEGELAEQYGLDAMPSSFVYDRNGVLRETHVGFHPGKVEQIEAELEALLAEEGDDAQTP